MFQTVTPPVYGRPTTSATSAASRFVVDDLVRGRLEAAEAGGAGHGDGVEPHVVLDLGELVGRQSRGEQAVRRVRRRVAAALPAGDLAELEAEGFAGDLEALVHLGRRAVQRAARVVGEGGHDAPPVGGRRRQWARGGAGGRSRAGAPLLSRCARPPRPCASSARGRRRGSARSRSCPWRSS